MEMERRISHRLVNFWQHIKGDRLLPGEKDIRRALIEDMWDNCFYIQLRGEFLQRSDDFYTYFYVGKALESLFDQSEKSPRLLTLPDDHFYENCKEMALTKLPVVENIESFRLPDGKNIKFRQCLLPVGTPEGKVEAVFGGLRWKAD